MKFNFSRSIALVSVIILLLTPKLNYAQFEDVGFDPDVNDEPTAPINGFIALGFLIGGYLGIRNLKE